MGFKEFDSSEIEEIKQKYEKEVQERWGGTKAFHQSTAKTSKYTDSDWERIKNEANEVYGLFASMMEKGATKEEKDIAARKWQQHITDNYYDCSDDIMLGLAEMYVCDERFKKNIDNYKAGLAEYMSEAIKDCFGK